VVRIGELHLVVTNCDLQHDISTRVGLWVGGS